MLYYQTCLCFLSVLSCSWIINIYLLFAKSVVLDDCIKNNLNSTNLVQCYNQDYDFTNRALYFCLAGHISLTFIIILITVLSCIGNICISEACSYGVEICETSLNNEENPSSGEGSGLVSKHSNI